MKQRHLHEGISSDFLPGSQPALLLRRCTRSFHLAHGTIDRRSRWGFAANAQRVYATCVSLRIHLAKKMPITGTPGKRCETRSRATLKCLPLFRTSSTTATIVRSGAAVCASSTRVIARSAAYESRSPLSWSAAVLSACTSIRCGIGGSKMPLDIVVIRDSYSALFRECVWPC